MANDGPMVFLWMGRRVEELSHAELVEVVIELGRENQTLLEDNMRRIRSSADLFRRNS